MTPSGSRRRTSHEPALARDPWPFRPCPRTRYQGMSRSDMFGQSDRGPHRPKLSRPWPFRPWPGTRYADMSRRDMSGSREEDRDRVSLPNAQALVDALALGSIYALVAVGIGLVFGVLRLVNFAYGELVTAGGYTLAYMNGYPAVLGILAAFAVVIALSLLLERVAFR